MLTDSSDSEDFFVDKYKPKVDLPDIIPCQQLTKNKTEPNLSEREKLMLETRKLINEEYSNKSSDSGTFEFEKKEKQETRKKTKKRVKKVKDDFVFKPAQLEKQRKDDDHDEIEDVKLSLNQEINEDEIPDVFQKSDNEEESDGPTSTGNWKAQGKNIPTEVITPKRTNPRLEMAMKKAHKSAQPVKSVFGKDIKPPPLAPPSQKMPGKGKRPMIKRKSKSVTSEEHSGSEKEESLSNESSSQENSSSYKLKGAILKAITSTNKQNQEEKEKEKQTKTIPAQTNEPSRDTINVKAINKMHNCIKTSPLQIDDEMKFSTFICSLEDQGKLTKRRFIKLFKDSEPLYSVKIKNILTDGNIGVSAGGDPHIGAREHAATIIVANDKTDYSLRNGTYQGQELITIRTTVNQNDGKSGHALFIHGIQGVPPIELYGYYKDDRTLLFKKKDSTNIYATFSLLTASTINVNCCHLIDAKRALAVCFALFMTIKR